MFVFTKNNLRRACSDLRFKIKGVPDMNLNKSILSSKISQKNSVIVSRQKIIADCRTFK